MWVELFRFCLRSVVRVLLKAGFAVDLLTPSGSALHEAALFGKIDVVRELVREGIQLRLLDAKQRTVIDILKEHPTKVTREIAMIIKELTSYPIEDALIEIEYSTLSRRNNGTLEHTATSSRRKGHRREKSIESSRLSKSLDSGSCLDESCGSSEHFSSDVSSTSRLFMPPYSGSLSQGIGGPCHASSSETSSPVLNKSDDLIGGSVWGASRSMDELDHEEFPVTDRNGLSEEGGLSRTIDVRRRKNTGRKAPQKPPRRSIAPPSPVPSPVGKAEHPYDFLMFANSPEGQQDDQPSLPRRPRGTRKTPHRISGSFDNVLDSVGRGGLDGVWGGLDVSLSSPPPPPSPFACFPPPQFHSTPTKKSPASSAQEEEEKEVVTVIERLPAAPGGPASSGKKRKAHKDKKRKGAGSEGEGGTGRRAKGHGEGGVGLTASSSCDDVLEGGMGKRLGSSAGGFFKRLTGGKHTRSHSLQISPPTALSTPLTVSASASPPPVMRNVVEVEGPSPEDTSTGKKKKYVSCTKIVLNGCSGREETPEREEARTPQTPLSPSHYEQPPTPEHPPPSPIRAREKITARMRPLSQEINGEVPGEGGDRLKACSPRRPNAAGRISPRNEKRSSRSIETETDEWLSVFADHPARSRSSGASSITSTTSDKSVCTDHIEEVVADEYLSSLLLGSTPGAKGDPAPSCVQRTSTSSTSTQKLPPPPRPPAPVVNGSRNPPSPSEFLSSLNLGSLCAEVETELQNRQLQSMVLGSGETPASTPSEGTLQVLSPFEEQKDEWARITEMMKKSIRDLPQSASVEEEEATTPVSCVPKTVLEWTRSIGQECYADLLTSNGFDDVEFLGNGIMTDMDLFEVGVLEDHVRSQLVEAAARLPCRLPAPKETNFDTLEPWLNYLRLDQYVEGFRRNEYADMEKIRRMWEVELAAVLEIELVGHRRRILVSLEQLAATPDNEDTAESLKTKDAKATIVECAPPTVSSSDLNADLRKLSCEIRELKALDRHSASPLKEWRQSSSPDVLSEQFPKPDRRQHLPISASSSVDSNISIRDPSHLVMGVSKTLATRWRHSPEDLIQGRCNYSAQYVGCTLVKKLRGTESTRKSIQKLKASAKTSRESGERTIVLNISHDGVRFKNRHTLEILCEHSIRNINCACQDAEDLSHFAYITQDASTKEFFCHVFAARNMTEATDVIMTIGQAFEVAYQLALKEMTTPTSSSAPPPPDRSSQDNSGQPPATAPQPPRDSCSPDTQAPHRHKCPASPSLPRDKRPTKCATPPPVPPPPAVHTRSKSASHVPSALALATPSPPPSSLIPRPKSASASSRPDDASVPVRRRKHSPAPKPPPPPNKPSALVISAVRKSSMETIPLPRFQRAPLASDEEF
ncbi:unnamed protein product [Cyprideis torosa]|uniref:Uncharacterized protein n=1 Tax=Cyprideis torosa TaxID=163714 RepID=A0A7R8ZS55_9CRUS|nr:unnamed protein product [Cyprideis torosa]CAG0894731.1 unnamed protein product [Cyprideis torosa]